MNNTSIYGLLDQYLIKDLTDLENLLEGNILLLQNRNSEILIKLEKVFLHQIKGKEMTRFANYSYKWFEHESAFFQKINYDDFLHLKSDYVERVDGILEISENEIIKYIRINIDLHIEKGIDSGLYLNNIIERMEGASNTLLKNFSKKNEYIIRHYKTKSSNPLITEAMQCVLNSQKMLKEKIITEFSKFLRPNHLDLENESYDNSYPDIFKSSENHQNFIKYIKDNPTDSLIKVISYGWKRMFFEDKVHKITDMELAALLKKINIIDEEQHNEIIIRGQLDSLDKSGSKSRRKSYNKIFTE